MILLISYASDPHVTEVIKHLEKKKASYVRLNTEEMPEQMKAQWSLIGKKETGILQLASGEKLHFADVTACWYRKPYLSRIEEITMSEQSKQFVREQSDAFFEDLWVRLSDRFWINYPHHIRQAGYKLTNLNLAAKLGLHIPQTIVTLDPQEARAFYELCQGNIVTKTLYGSLLLEEDKQYGVYTHKLTAKDLERMESVRYAPTLFQEYIEKKIELRVTIVGRKIFACEIHSQDSERTKIDWRHYDNDKVKHREHTLPKSIEKKLLQLMDHYDLNYGAIDLILTPKGEYVFLEINPNGQYLWIEHLTGMPISKAIADLLLGANKQR